MFDFLRRPRVKHPNAPTVYQYHPGPIWQQPGADGMVFEPVTTTPLIEVQANGYFAGSLAPTAPQLYNPVLIGQNGIPVFAGQYFGQPLSDPNAGS